MIQSSDLYISIIRYSKTKLSEGVTPLEVFNALKKKFKLDEDRQKKIFCIFFVENHTPIDGFHYNRGQEIAILQEHHRKKIFTLDKEAYFNELEFTELQEARENSKEARWLSIVAIIISFLTIIVSCSPSPVEVTNTVNTKEVLEILKRPNQPAP